eukprot:c25649_g1_i1.p1 GENE.c25649_g1_i1~~c25649_g1_i1.p1  ORF type:complete len:339 (-),score=55.29 c25649_g1_i1:25-1041(-)
MLFVVALCLGLALSSPVPQTSVEFNPEAISQLEIEYFQSETADNITISCPLCSGALDTLLDFCKEFDGRSIPRVPEFVSKCSLVGEEDLKKQDETGGCGSELRETRSRARIWNRKIRCLKLYNIIANLYSPFDPCTQIRTAIQKTPSALCESPQVSCVMPVTFEDDPFVMPPGIPENFTVTFEHPPLTCPQYVASLDAACKQLKQADFYRRSSLEDFCNSTFFGRTHQVSGCETVRAAMDAQDSMMDLCGSLFAVPITSNYSSYCTETLKLPGNETVPDAGYEAYLVRLKTFNELLEARRNPFKKPEFPKIEWPTDAVDVSLEQTEPAPKEAPQVQES